MSFSKYKFNTGAVCLISLFCYSRADLCKNNPKSKNEPKSNLNQDNNLNFNQVLLKEKIFLAVKGFTSDLMQTS